MHRSVKELSDLCDLQLPKNSYRFKSSIADRYGRSYWRLLSDLLNGPILHIDETPVKLRTQHGYVWVFANMETVFFEYRSSRKGDFLSERLGGFEGVLVSDFFSAYDAIDCPQQKCVLHLIRDINDAMRRNPFDEELRRLAQGFASVFRAIIGTVDRYGLKRRHLNKHKKETKRFFKNFCGTPSSSEVAGKFQERFQKYGDRLFTFLEFDGVPWNNNNAEHAINLFAKYRRFADGTFTETSLKTHLVLLSVLMTCEYRNVNPLQFLLSGAEDLPM